MTDERLKRIKELYDLAKTPKEAVCVLNKEETQDLLLTMMQYKHTNRLCGELVNVICSNPEYFPNIHVGDDCLRGIIDWLKLYVQFRKDQAQLGSDK